MSEINIMVFISDICNEIENDVAEEFYGTENYLEEPVETDKSIQMDNWFAAYELDPTLHDAPVIEMIDLGYDDTQGY